MFGRSLITLLFLVLCVASLPVEEALLTVPLSKQTRSLESGNIVLLAQTRAGSLRRAGLLQGRADPTPVSLADGATIYTASVSALVLTAFQPA